MKIIWLSLFVIATAFPNPSFSSSSSSSSFSSSPSLTFLTAAGDNDNTTIPTNTSGGCCMYRCCDAQSTIDQTSCCENGHRCLARRCVHVEFNQVYVTWFLVGLCGIAILFSLFFCCCRRKQISTLTFKLNHDLVVPTPCHAQLSIYFHLTYPFSLILQMRVAADTWFNPPHSSDGTPDRRYFYIVAISFAFTFLLQNYLFFVLLCGRLPARRIYNIVVKHTHYVSGLSVLYLWRYIPYFLWVKSDISVFNSTWGTVMSRNKFFDLVLIAVSTTCYVLTIRLNNPHFDLFFTPSADLLFNPSSLLLIANALWILYRFGVEVTNRFRLWKFKRHEKFVREQTDITVAKNPLTFEQAQIAFCIEFGEDLHTNAADPEPWYETDSFMINGQKEGKGTRLTHATYNKKTGRYNVEEVELEPGQEQSVRQHGDVGRLFSSARAKNLHILRDLSRKELLKHVRGGVQSQGVDVHLGNLGRIQSRNGDEYQQLSG